MALKHSYTLLAPVYDIIVSGPIDAFRIKSISRLDNTKDQKILINGIGSGLDIPYLPADAYYTGTDITPAMLARAKRRADVVFEDALKSCPQLKVMHDEPALAKGWFRLIELKKDN